MNITEYGVAYKEVLEILKYLPKEDYKKIQKYDYKKLQHNPNYRVVLVGPSPHSGRGKGNSSSTITAIEQGKYYPPVIRLQGSNGLKITKTNFRETLEQLIEDGFIWWYNKVAWDKYPHNLFWCFLTQNKKVFVILRFLYDFYGTVQSLCSNIQIKMYEFMEVE